MTSHSKQCVIFYSSNTLPEEIKISKWPLHASFFTNLLIRALRSISIFFFFSNNDNKQLPLKQLMMLTILYNMESILWFMSSSIIIKEKQKLMLLESSTSYIVQACNWSKKRRVLSELLHIQFKETNHYQSEQVKTNLEIVFCLEKSEEC